MFCTECGKKIEPVVAVDIDGTLGNYHAHFLSFAAGYLGTNLADVPGWYDNDLILEGYTGAMGFREWFCQATGTDQRTWYDIKLAYRQGAQKRSMPVYDCAPELCMAIREAGAELWLTTTRPYLRLDNVDPDTRAWLERHEIGFDGLLYDEHKYDRLAEYVDPARVVAVVDDLPEQIDAAARLFGYRVPILRRTPYNSAIPADEKTAFQNLKTIRQEVERRINEWKGSRRRQADSVHHDPQTPKASQESTAEVD